MQVSKADKLQEHNNEGKAKEKNWERGGRKEKNWKQHGYTLSFYKGYFREKGCWTDVKKRSIWQNRKIPKLSPSKYNL